ncbi:MAG: triose-phosphate isomerase [bacterium]|nr:triose-phosphate isomerase [bacterium]
MKLLIANWKMNPNSEKQALALAKLADSDGVVVCPPFPFITAISKKIKRADLGAQDVSSEDEGAFTGQVSGKQLKSLGVMYVILGHSERRRLGEGNDLVAKKVMVTIQNGLTPILCVGENKDEHVTGRTKEIIERQLDLNLALIGRQVPAARIIIAYEPVWAISGGDPLSESDTPENAAEIVAFIRERLKGVPVRATVIYGGSVNAENIASFLAQKEIDGVLVGGASLRPEFRSIVKIAEKF